MADTRSDIASVRETVVDVFTKLLPEIEAKDLEIGIYNSTIDFASANRIPLSWSSDHFKEAYLTKARGVYANLHTSSYVGNVRLMDRLKEKEFLPHNIASMPRENIFPERWREIRETEEKRLQGAYEVTATAMSDQITCGKCKKKQISYYEKQTRSADEATTIFYTCLQCGHRWSRN